VQRMQAGCQEELLAVGDKGGRLLHGIAH